MGEYEPNDSRNVTGTAVSRDGRWTADAATDPNMTDAQRQAQQGGVSPGQQGSQGSQQGFAEPFTQQQAAQAGRQGQQQVGGQPRMGQQQAGQSGQAQAPQQNMGGSQGAIGQANDGVSNTQNQDNDHTSAIGKNQSSIAGAGQAQQFQDTSGQMGGGQGASQGGAGRFADQIAKHQEVVDANGQHVGTVDHVDGGRIKLTRQDSADGQHHYVSMSDVQGIEGGKVCLSSSASVTR